MTDAKQWWPGLLWGLWCFMCLNSAANAQEKNCGYGISVGEYTSWPNAYHGWVEIQNNTAQPATQFSLHLDLGGAKVHEAYQAEFSVSEDAYLVESPPWLAWQTIPPGESFRFHFQANGANTGIRPYITAINSQACDLTPPQLSFQLEQSFFTAPGILELSATASDDAAITKVVFQHQGQVIAVANEEPYTASFSLDATLNGRQVFTATAYDTSGNTASEHRSTLVAINNKFFGTALESDIEYEKFLSEFTQVTPGNAGKWGTVEATRDVMNWGPLDKAFQFAEDNQLLFKMHTLVWGSQQPTWVNELPAEQQLAEVEQWFSMVSQRYGHIPLIDVVNEPLHAPPAYREALGGAGETGWDWVINAFRMARQYFPDSELILNDYNILIFAPFTSDYLEIIQLLQQRNLIDGIGLQAHFLERAEIAVVSDNLDRLAATGLPIYISELDINFRQDARQAQRLSELFRLFWQHPAVVGVTHWGFVEGAMWRENAFLLTSSNEQRPALNWLRCFLANASPCALPEYTPAPRTGDISGLKVEAEDYDESDGVLALGDVLSYVDQGDRTVYQRMQFNSNWDTLEIRYAKGNEGLGAVEVYLNEIDDRPEASILLPNTGGWGSYATVSVPWLPVEGEQTIILQFTDAYGVGNIDNFHFGATKGLGKNLLNNGHFESNAQGWFTWDGNLSVNQELAASGQQSLLLSQRNGNGPAATEITNLVSRGETYTFSVWGRVGNAASATMNITQKTQCVGEAATYTRVVAPTPVTTDTWQNLQGEVLVPDCPIEELLIYAEGPPGGVDIYLDHAWLRSQQSVNLVENGTFETDSNGWFTWNGNLSTSSTRARSGEQSLLHSQRGNNAPAVFAISDAVTPGTAYEVTFWASIAGAATSQINLTSKIQCENEPATYAWLAEPTEIYEVEWLKLSGTLAVPDCPLAEVLIYTEGPEAGIDVYIDDVSVVAPTINNLLSNPGFEENSTAGWTTWDGILTVNNEFARSGEQSLKLSGRSGNGPAAAILTQLAAPGTAYDVSFWISIGGAAQANVNLTRKIQCAGESASYAWLVAPQAVRAGEWQQFRGTLEVPDCDLADLLVYAEGPAGGIDIYLDDIVIRPLDTKP